MNYWHIETWDKEIIRVKPEPESQIKYIQNLISRGEGAVVMPTQTIPIKNIKDFRLSDEVFIDQKLVEATSQALREPIITKDGSIKVQWVKKSVPRRRWENFYRYHASYKLLVQSDSSVLIAFRLPIHLINHEVVSDLTSDEETNLTKFL